MQMSDQSGEQTSHSFLLLSHLALLRTAHGTIQKVKPIERRQLCKVGPGLVKGPSRAQYEFTASVISQEVF
jgi:hypothetical protein